ncbi:hypothetical protein Bca4012_083674 [Brassica carinata]
MVCRCWSSSSDSISFSPALEDGDGESSNGCLRLSAIVVREIEIRQWSCNDDDLSVRCFGREIQCDSAIDHFVLSHPSDLLFLAFSGDDWAHNAIRDFELQSQGKKRHNRNKQKGGCFEHRVRDGHDKERFRIFLKIQETDGGERSAVEAGIFFIAVEIVSAQSYLKRLFVLEDKVLDLVRLIQNWSMPLEINISKSEHQTNPKGKRISVRVVVYARKKPNQVLMFSIRMSSRSSLSIRESDKQTSHRHGRSF